MASLGQLAAGVAHEINNPMAIILGYADMLLEKTEENSKEYKILKTIERQGNNCKRIVENLMSFARMPEGVQYDTDVNRNIELVLEVVQNTLLTKKIEYELLLAENLPRVRGDAGQLQQVFMNLLTNAVKAMPQGGKLSITSRLNQAGDKVEVLITDTGEGIKREHLSKIFDPFFTTRKVGEGTGLGLSVSYAIVAKFGGTIYCASKSKEEVGEAESGRPSPFPCRSLSQMGGGMNNQKKPSPGKILIVDDEPDMLEMLDMIITDKTSHQVVTTNNPLEVGEILAKGQFNLVITDLKMPIMDGMDVIAAVKSQNADIPVVVITAFGTIESAEEAVRRGAYDFITKPFRKEQILVTIERAMDWQRLMRENRELKRHMKNSTSLI